MALVLASLALGCGAHVVLNMRDVRLSDRIHLFVGGWSNSLALAGKDGVFLVDAKVGNWSHEMHAAIPRELGETVSRLLLTHYHTDHAGGLPVFREAKSVLAHPNTRARLEKAARGEPWIDVARELHLFVGDEDVWVYYFGRGHTDGDLVALLPKERILATGDLYIHGFAPLIDVEGGGSVSELESTVGKMLSLDFDTVLPGHGDPATRADLERFHRYLVDMKVAVGEGVRRGETEDDVTRTVTMADYADYQPFLAITSREKNVRQMYRDLREAGRRAP